MRGGKRDICLMEADMLKGSYLIISNGDSTTFFLSTMYGISAVCLALLIATVTISWCLLQLPVNLLGMILNLSESENLSCAKSL